MWPEPKDLAYIVAAVIAGSFTRLSSLSGRDSNISTLKSEWLKVFRDEIASLSSVSVKVAIIKRNIKGLNESLMENFDESILADKKNYEFELNEMAKEFQKSRYLIMTKLNRDKQSQADIYAAMEELRENLKIQISEYGEESVQGMHKAAGKLVKFANKFSKEEWESIKGGDKKINRKVRKQNRIMMAVVGIYVIYIVGYSFLI